MSGLLFLAGVVAFVLVVFWTSRAEGAGGEP